MPEPDKRPIAATDPLVALALLTRLPLPVLSDAAFARQAQAAWAYPLVGLVVALPASVLAVAALWAGLPVTAAAGLLLAAQIALTGAMHEDGLADVADGFWGAFDRTRRLEIMRDSRIGTYGVLALILSVGLRWVALTALLQTGFGAVIAAACLSRAGLPALMTLLPPARPDGLSVSVGIPGRRASLVALTLGVALALSAAGAAVIGPAIAGVAVLGATGLLARARIGGQTGDVLGAAQQVTEVTVLLGLAALI